MAFTNAVLFAALPKSVEKNREPAHFKQLFYDQPTREAHSITHPSDRNESFHSIPPGSGGELGQEFFSSSDE